MTGKHFKNSSSMRGILLGLIISLAITLTLTAGIAVLIRSEHISEKYMLHFSFVAQLISCLIGFVIAGKTGKEKIALRVGTCLLLYYLIMIGIGLILLEGSLHFSLSSMFSAIISYVLACAICINKGKRSRTKKRASR